MTHRLHLLVYVLLIELAISLPAHANTQGNVIGFVHIYIYIREYGSTLYVGLARAVSLTNTNFRLTFY